MFHKTERETWKMIDENGEICKIFRVDEDSVKNQTENLQLRNVGLKFKNSLDDLKRRVDITKTMLTE